MQVFNCLTLLLPLFGGRVMGRVINLLFGAIFIVPLSSTSFSVLLYFMLAELSAGMSKPRMMPASVFFYACINGERQNYKSQAYVLPSFSAFQSVKIPVRYLRPLKFKRLCMHVFQIDCQRVSCIEYLNKPESFRSKY